MARSEAPPLVAHVVHTLRVGGMENGLVNLINRTPPGRLRHAVVCLTDYDRFAERIEAPAVPVMGLGKREGKDPATYLKLWRALRRLAPDLVHTRNLATLEAQLPAALAGVPARVYGEDGRDMTDLDGGSRKYRWLRRAYRPLIHAYVPLSGDLEDYLRSGVGVPAGKITRIRNGVDVERFRPAKEEDERPYPPAFAPAGTTVVGWVGRMEPVKAPMTLARAFVRAVTERPELRGSLRLAMIGDGTLYPEVRELLETAGMADLAWLPGARNDIAGLLRSLDVFALPSLAEGISNTVLEAMASGVPVVATRVGGNPELVAEGETGALVAPGDEEGLAAALTGYAGDPKARWEHGAAARRRAVRQFSIDAMVASYLALYERLLGGRQARAPETAGASG